MREDNVRPAGRKGVKGLLLVGHEKVPHGFGLRTGDLTVLGTEGGLPGPAWNTDRNREK